jgi:hypothetical protein
MFRTNFIYFGLIFQFVLIVGFEHQKFKSKTKYDCLTKVIIIFQIMNLKYSFNS